MKTLFDASAALEMKARISQLRPESERQWGKMNPAQALAHCVGGFKLALGDITPPRTVIGWTIGPLIKKMVLKDEEPIGLLLRGRMAAPHTRTVSSAG